MSIFIFIVTFYFIKSVCQKRKAALSLQYVHYIQPDNWIMSRLMHINFLSSSSRADEVF